MRSFSHVHLRYQVRSRVLYSRLHLSNKVVKFLMYVCMYVYFYKSKNLYVINLRKYFLQNCPKIYDSKYRSIKVLEKLSKKVL